MIGGCKALRWLSSTEQLARWIDRAAKGWVWCQQKRTEGRGRGAAALGAMPVPRISMPTARQIVMLIRICPEPDAEQPARRSTRRRETTHQSGLDRVIKVGARSTA